MWSRVSYLNRCFCGWVVMSGWDGLGRAQIIVLGERIVVRGVMMCLGGVFVG